MNWTIDRPTVPGFYWLRTESPGWRASKAGPAVVHLEEGTVYWPGNDDGRELSELYRNGEIWEWFGPLEIPK